MVTLAMTRGARVFKSFTKQNVDETIEENQQISSLHIDQSVKVESEQTLDSNNDKDMLLDDMDIINDGVAQELETEMS
uniref:Uncharacterized protein n=1 Tax=Romanomermis culicivorax TaxID=13658 RepID=A0A915KDM2_ROMCU